MSRPYIVEAHKIKDIKLPFNGLYNSFIGTELDNAFECVNDDLTEQQSILLYDYLNNDYSYNSVLSKYNNKVCLLYSEYLADLITDQYKKDLVFNKVEYIYMDGQNRGDSLHADFNVSYLPSIDAIVDTLSITVNEVWQGLQSISNDNFTSYSGFNSFYDADIMPLVGVPYEEWNDAYIMVLIEYLSYNLDIVICEHYPISDIEQCFLEEINTTGGAIEILYSVMTSEQCDKLNSLLYPDMP